MRQPGGRVLERHRPGEAETLLDADIGRYPDAANGWTAGDVVDRDDRPEASGRLVDMHNLGRPKLIGEVERVVHTIPFQ